MTGQAIYDVLTPLLDGVEIDTDLFLTLANTAKDIIEEKRPWMYLRKLNSSNTASVGNNYTTNITLPSDFRYDRKVFVGETTEYFPVEFEKWHQYKNSPQKYVIDVASDVYHLLGNIGKADTIYFYYIKTTDDLTLSNSPSFPARFHKLLAYYVAGIYMNGIDADDVFARMSPEHKAQARALEEGMAMWDSQLQMRSRNNQLNYAGSEPTLALGDM